MHPKSKPAMLTPVNSSFPVALFVLVVLQLPLGAGDGVGIETVEVGGVVLGLEVGLVTGLEVTGLDEAVPGRHWE